MRMVERKESSRRSTPFLSSSRFLDEELLLFPSRPKGERYEGETNRMRRRKIY